MNVHPQSEITLSQKLAFLRLPQSYPERTHAVDAVETHISWVFLTERRAYKLKKPVRHDFLDFSTLESRRISCFEEVRLNRRLARHIYLGAVPLYLNADGKLDWESDGPIVDWLVKMRRLPAERMLDYAVQHDTVAPTLIEKAAQRLSAFYGRADPISFSPEAYERRFIDDIAANRQELSNPVFGLSLTKVNQASDALLAFIQDQTDLIQEPARARRIVEAHGDLRPEHICLLQQPVFIDCLEFRRDFRLLDPVDELAFLSLECMRLRAAWIGEIFFDVYRAASGIVPPQSLIDFYMSHRACLRAKLAAWHVKDTPAQREKWIGRADEYLRLAVALSERLR